ncbi:MAG: hypothetical protein AAF480_04390 [Actinomycetota bacterium]
MRVVAFAPDLMDQSKLRAAGVEIVRSVGALAEVEADRVLVDLSRPGVLDAIADVDAEVIGFGPHVDDDLLQAGRAAGCSEVLARSVFFRRLPALAAGDGV